MTRENVRQFLAETGRSLSPQFRALVRGMDDIERIDRYLRIEQEEFGGRKLIVGALRGRRLHVAGDTGDVLEEDAPAAPTDAHVPAQARADGGKHTFLTDFDDVATESPENDERTEEEFEEDVSAALSLARSLFDDVDDARERLIEEVEKGDDKEKHVVAALNRRIDELQES
jgi:hypothetical protein